jgi:hypothetical protein
MFSTILLIRNSYGSLPFLSQDKFLWQLYLVERLIMDMLRNPRDLPLLHISL